MNIDYRKIPTLSINDAKNYDLEKMNRDHGLKYMHAAGVDEFLKDPYYVDRKFAYPSYLVSEDYHITD